MELHWFWEAILIFYAGTFILRIGGRKSISQMTISQTVVMIGLGSLLIQPITGNGLFNTFGAALLLSVLMIITEYIEVKVDVLEGLFSGKAVMIIKNGKVNIKNLKKLRLSIDRLETRLRQAGIASIDEVKYATMEVSGQLGYELKDNKKPITKEDFGILMSEISKLKDALGITVASQSVKNITNNIFEEIRDKRHEGDRREP